MQVRVTTYRQTVAALQQERQALAARQAQACNRLTAEAEQLKESARALAVTRSRLEERVRQHRTWLTTSGDRLGSACREHNQRRTAFENKVRQFQAELELRKARVFRQQQDIVAATKILNRQLADVRGVQQLLVLATRTLEQTYMYRAASADWRVQIDQAMSPLSRGK